MSTKTQKRREKAERMRELRADFAAQLRSRGFPPELADACSGRKERNRLLSTGVLRDRTKEMHEHAESVRASRELLRHHSKKMGP